MKKMNFTDDATARWSAYLAGLNWGPGNRDASGWQAFIRARTLQIEPNVALNKVTQCIRCTGGGYDLAKLDSQLRRAYNQAGLQVRSALVAPRCNNVQFSPELLKKVAGRVTGVDEKWVKSKSPQKVAGITSADFLNVLYKRGEHILVFEIYKSQGQHLFTAGSKQQLCLNPTEDGAWFLSNPVDGAYHPNPRQQHKLSRRSEESITTWRYMVVESDVEQQEQWLAALVQLPLKVSAIYTSGRKSVHALIRIDARSKQEWDQERDQMRQILVPLGVDANAMHAVQLSRLPGAMRGGKLQELLYLNPNPKDEPIFRA